MLAWLDLRGPRQGAALRVEGHGVAAGQDAQGAERVEAALEAVEAVLAAGEGLLGERAERFGQPRDLAMQAVQLFARVLGLQALAELLQARLPQRELGVERILEPLAQAIEAQLAIADQPARIGDAHPLQLRPLALDLPAQRAQQPRPALRHVG